MKLAVLLILVLLGTDTPEVRIPYFSNVRDVQVVHPEKQNFLVVDQELWLHSRPDLGDLRLYDADRPVQYALSEQRAGVASEEIEAKILNLGSVSGHTEFDLDTNGLAEYDRIRLRLDAHDFVARASVSGGNTPGEKSEVGLAPSTLYDFSKEQLGSSFLLKLPPSSFRFLHVRLSPGIRPQQVKGAAIYNVHELQASWTNAGSCGPPQQRQRATVFVCSIPAKVPLNRILFQVAPEQVNFRRTIRVEDPKGQQIASGEISRVRVNRGDTRVTSEELVVNVAGRYDQLTVFVDNGDNPPLAITAVQPLSLERRIYFDPEGKSSLRLYYGDERLASPLYDYARFFHADASPALAELSPGAHNPQYAGRPDDRPWSERHPVILWGAMLLAVLGLAILALRGLRATTTPG